MAKILKLDFLAAEVRNLVFKDGSWAAVGQMASAIGSLIGIRLLTQYLSPEVFGTINLMLGISALAYGLLCFPVSQAALRFYSEEEKKGRLGVMRRTVGKILQQRTIIILAFILTSGAAYSVATKTSYWVFIALAAILVADIIRGMQTTYFQAARRHKEYSLWNLAEAWLKPLSIVLVAAFIGTSLHTILFGYVLASTTLAFVVFMMTNWGNDSGDQQNNSPDSELVQEINRFALPLIPLTIVGWISGLSDRYIIGGILGLEQVGIYTAVYGLVSRPFLMAGAIIEQTLRPIYFEAVTSGMGSRALEVKTFKIWLVLTAAVCVVGIIVVMLLRGQIGTLLLAERYRSGIYLMPWIAFGYSLLIMSNVFEKPCYAYKKTRSVLIIQVCGAVASICIAVPMIYHFGLGGAALSLPLYFGVQLLLSISFAHSIMRGR